MKRFGAMSGPCGQGSEDSDVLFGSDGFGTRPPGIVAS